MDFVHILSRQIESGPHKGELEVYPDYRVGRSKDLMVRGRAFYAIWDEEAKLWSTDEYDVQRLVDAELRKEVERLERENGIRPKVKLLGSFNTNSWSQFRKYLQNISDNSHPLDETLTFSDTEVKKSDYASKRLPYPLAAGSYSAWDELIGTLYNTEERAKLEWAIGAIISGDSKKIQKFLVLYGAAGTGKSTYLNVLQSLFGPYVTTFDAKALGSSSAAFATEVFKENPLVAIQHDGDLSKIEDNTTLNSIISHEDMTMNQKYKPTYTDKSNAFLFMGTNQPVKISDAKSGIIRRLIDVHPTGVKIPSNHYFALMSQVEFELGAIAYHGLQVYRDMGQNYYNSYRPVEMMFQTDVFFNFIEAYFDVFKAQDGVSLKHAYALYKEFCSDTGIDRVLPQYKVREELRNYFDEFHDRGEINGTMVRSLYVGFNANKFKAPVKDDVAYSLVLDEDVSLLDESLADMPAQYGKDDETPKTVWSRVKTVLSEIDTKQLHYVKVPQNHIVIDFDLKDEDGTKSRERNLQAASQWLPTYAELSKGGAGVHLHYIYDGDTDELSPLHSEGIEVKVYRGDSALRRRLSKCNNVPIATISSGLPKKEKKMLSDKTIKSERGLRDLIGRNMRKEIHPNTKSSIEFIDKILKEAHASGLTYDLTDLRPRMFAFANNSSNNALYCMDIVQNMLWASEPGDISNGPAPEVKGAEAFIKPKDDKLVFFDVEVYPNLFVICWKFEGPDATVVRMINPTAQEVENLFNLKLVGFNNRRYDNHILYGAYMGYTNKALFELSEKIVNNNRSGMFGEAYNLSWTDIYDYSSEKKSLKKFQIDLGLPHVEMDIPWDQPVPEDLIQKIVDYCANDVLTTEAVHNSRLGDYIGRQILADLSGLTVNDPTPKHTAKILFGNDRRPQSQFVYTNLAEQFPGYEYSFGKSQYRGENPSEGGYVYAEPGIYENVAVLDVTSMHPHSMINLNLFGDEYTKNLKELVEVRVAIKNQEFDKARKMMDGKLAPHLQNTDNYKMVADALKIAINTIYGLTSAKFDNPFRDVRNVDNIVAKRGALFMIDLKHAVQEQGYQVVHIKTDSIKIPNATEEIITFVTDFGANYGYNFEHEDTYDKFCLVNDAVYIARRGEKWSATGAQFAQPYVFKKLFSGEDITFEDLCETKQVAQAALYLDFEPDKEADISRMRFVGRTGRFTPIKEGRGGGVLYRVKDDKLHAATGTKGHFWLEAEEAKKRPREDIDMGYFDGLVEDAIKNIEKYGPFAGFAS